ncbi:hypothetical protein NIES2098_42260 [Calothrix sp. NIES-2098]|nr:hypothetical protein NIES2098_42260 [Calothrix sp. NIES-2098]
MRECAECAEWGRTRRSHCVVRVSKALRWAASLRQRQGRTPTCSLKAFPFASASPKEKGRKCRRVVASGVDKVEKINDKWLLPMPHDATCYPAGSRFASTSWETLPTQWLPHAHFSTTCSFQQAGKVEASLSQRFSLYGETVAFEDFDNICFAV